MFTTDKKTRYPNFVVVLYHSGSIGVVLVDTCGRPVSNVHMKHKCEVAVRQGRRGVPDDCECLGIRRNRMSEDKSVEIEVAWKDGRVTWEDLMNIYRTAPWMCILYAARKKLTRRKAWKSLTKLKKGQSILSSATPRPQQERKMLPRRSERINDAKREEEERKRKEEESRKRSIHDVDTSGEHPPVLSRRCRTA